MKLDRTNRAVKEWLIIFAELAEIKKILFFL
jgi:hypothetical protein